MRKISLLMFLLLLNYAQSQSSNIIDIVSIKNQIDENSENFSKSDILLHLNDEEVPDLYRLGVVFCKKFYIDQKLVKVELQFIGDRETLFETFYFNDTSEPFFVSSEYMLYSPPKWEDSSRIVLSNKSNFVKMNNNWSSYKQSTEFPERLKKLIMRKDMIFGVGEIHYR